MLQNLKNIESRLIILSSHFKLSITNINNNFRSFREGSAKYQGNLLVSITTKSIGNNNLSTLTITFSTTPYEYLIDLLANCNVILIDLTSKSPIIFSIARGIKFILAPKFNKTLSRDKTPMFTGILTLVLPNY